MKTNDFSSILETLSLMKSEERIAFFNQLISTHPKQTIAQKIYDTIYKIEQKKNKTHVKTMKNISLTHLT